MLRLKNFLCFELNSGTMMFITILCLINSLAITYGIEYFKINEEVLLALHMFNIDDIFKMVIIQWTLKESILITEVAVWTVFAILFSVLLVMGVYKENHYYIFTWLVYHLGEMGQIMYLATTYPLQFKHIDHKIKLKSLAAFMALIINFPIHLYMWFAVYSYYVLVRDKGNNETL